LCKGYVAAAAVVVVGGGGGGGGGGGRGGCVIGGRGMRASLLDWKTYALKKKKKTLN
jgi:hypothetical protein